MSAMTHTSDGSNFRSIALCSASVFSTLFDNIILLHFSDRLRMCDLQFGFKQKISTNLCTNVFQEAIAYYVKSTSLVHCTFLDTTTAFYSVNHYKLFSLLIKRGLPACVIGVVINLHLNNFVRLSWCGIYSDYFCSD